MSEPHKRLLVGNLRRPVVDTLRASLHAYLDRILDSLTYDDDSHPDLTGPDRQISRNSVEVLVDTELTSQTAGYWHLELRVSMTPSDVWRALQERADFARKMVERSGVPWIKEGE
jgi:hypothetical protein